LRQPNDSSTRQRLLLLDLMACDSNKAHETTATHSRHGADLAALPTFQQATMNTRTYPTTRPRHPSDTQEASLSSFSTHTQPA
jgi:hypothetical protein